MNKKAAIHGIILMGMVILLIGSAGCTAAQNDGDGEGIGNESYTTVTVAEIEESLKDKGPITVGLDIDGTAYFTESIYYYGLNNIDGPNGTNLFGDQPLSNSEFIGLVNNEFAGQYIPKVAAKDIVEMHQMRGDTVIFITKKCSSPEERISDYIAVEFGIEDPVLIFTNEMSKTPYINEENVSVYYGDSDGDITDSLEADDCTPYRFLRNPIAEYYYNTSYNPGMYDESIVVDSYYR